MNPVRIARKTAAIAFAGLTALASTTFQNGCATSIPMDDFSSLLGEFTSDYYYDSYGSWDEYDHGGYDSYGGYYESPLDWDLLDVKSG